MRNMKMTLVMVGMLLFTGVAQAKRQSILNYITSNSDILSNSPRPRPGL